MNDQAPDEKPAQQREFERELRELLQRYGVRVEHDATPERRTC